MARRSSKKRPWSGSSQGNRCLPSGGRMPYQGRRGRPSSHRTFSPAHTPQAMKLAATIQWLACAPDWIATPEDSGSDRLTSARRPAVKKAFSADGRLSDHRALVHPKRNRTNPRTVRPNASWRDVCSIDRCLSWSSRRATALVAALADHLAAITAPAAGSAG